MKAAVYLLVYSTSQGNLKIRLTHSNCQISIPNLLFNQCWHNKAMLKEFALCMSTCIDKLHTTYLKPFIFFKSVYRLLDGAWGRS